MARAYPEPDIERISHLVHMAVAHGYNVEAKYGERRHGILYVGWEANDTNRPVSLKLERRDKIRWSPRLDDPSGKPPSPWEYSMGFRVKDVYGIVTATHYFADDPTYVLYVFPRDPRTVGMKQFQEDVNVEYAARRVRQRRHNNAGGGGGGGRDSGYDSSSGMVMNPLEAVGSRRRRRHLRKVGMGEARASFLFRQVAKQQADLFRLGIVHQDVRLQNLLVDPSTGAVSLIDFSKAEFVQPGEYTEYTGCPHYTPPEVFLHGAYTAEDRVVWSLGLILLSFLTGISPGQVVTRELYSGAEEGNMAWPAREKVVELEARLNRVIRHLPARFTMARDLLARCLARDPAHRIRLAQIMNHPWLVDGARLWLELAPTE